MEQLFAGDALLKVQPLTEAKIAQAFPLVRFLQPRLSLEDWQQFSAAQLGAGQDDRGILTVEDDRGYILAMLTYSVDSDLSHGRTLVAKHVIALTSLERSRKLAISALFQSLEELAKEKRCMAVHTRLAVHSADKAECSLRASLMSIGHAVDQFVLCKTL